MDRMLLSVTVLISAARHRALSVAITFFLYYPFCMSFPSGSTVVLSLAHTFIPEWYRFSVILPLLGCCHCPLAPIISRMGDFEMCSVPCHSVELDMSKGPFRLLPGSSYPEA